jgi:hypothetical protein
MADADSTFVTSRCANCGLTKAAECFHKASHHKNGLSSRCRDCQKAYNDAYRERAHLRVSFAERAAAKAAAPDRMCPKCKIRKDRSEFSADRRRKDGLRPWCKFCRNAYNKKWRQSNPEKMAAAVKAWGARNPDRVKAKRDKSNARMWAIPSHRLRIRIGSRLRDALGSRKDWRSSMAIVGYTVDELRSHLERQFVAGMGWHNMSEWHIDHIVPLSSFNISSPEDDELRRAWALSNLRPIWARENRIKKDKRLFLL